MDSLILWMRRSIGLKGDLKSLVDQSISMNSLITLIYRIFWAIVMTFCFIGSSFLIYEMTMKVKDDSIVTYLSDVPVQVVDVSEQDDERKFDQSFVL